MSSTLRMAMAAWAAKVVSTSVWCSSNGATSVRQAEAHR